MESKIDITAENYLKTCGITLNALTVIAFIDSVMRQPDICVLMENYAKEKINEATLWNDIDHHSQIRNLPRYGEKIVFKLKTGDIRLGSLLKKDQFDRTDIFCDGSFHTVESVESWKYI